MEMTIPLVLGFVIFREKGRTKNISLALVMLFIIALIFSQSLPQQEDNNLQVGGSPAQRGFRGRFYRCCLNAGYRQADDSRGRF